MSVMLRRRIRARAGDQETAQSFLSMCRVDESYRWRRKRETERENRITNFDIKRDEGVFKLGCHSLKRIDR